MPRTSSLIAAVAAAFAVAVPTAAAEGQPTGSHRWATQPAASDTYHGSMAAIATEQATLSARRSPGTVNALEARERALGARNESVLASDFYADGFAEAVASRESRPEPVRDDRFRIGPTNAPVLVTPSPGTDVEWPQIGIGAGLGLLAAIGLLLALRTTRDRRLAH